MLLLWGFYVLFLEKENMHYTKRFYLIFSMVFALIIPLITFTYQTSEVQVAPETIPQPVTTMVFSEEVSAINPPVPSVNYWPLLLWSIYGIGLLIFGYRFMKNLRNLNKKIKSNERLKEPSHINVLVSDSIIPHTFLKYIFVPKKEYQEKNIPEEVLLHEKTHVTQKHTLDILFVEILHVVFWFNPLFFWIKKAIKLNHEFLADQTVIKRQFSLQTYINLLVTYPNSSHQTALSSPINYSLTKKRILMMSQQFSKTRAAARLLLLLPLLMVCMLLFNNEIIAQQKSIKYTKTLQDTHPDKKIKIRVKNEQITLNGATTSLSNFAGAIDDMTKQWKDDELTEFQFDVQIQNSDDSFVEKLNDQYRKTRLYNANPDGHDLIPPPPPLPPRVRKGQVGNIPPPPAPRVKKGQKSNIPQPPKPESPPTPFSSSQVEVEMESEIAAEEAMLKAEIAREEAEVEHEYEIANAMEVTQHAKHSAMHQAHQAREAAEHAKHRAMQQAHQAREAAEHARHRAMESAHRAREHSHRVREEAMEKAQMALEVAEKARAVAIEEARFNRERVMQDRDKLLEEARAVAEQARKVAEKARKEARKEAEKARAEVRKEAEKARKVARKEMEKARKERQKAKEKAEKSRNQ